MLEPKVLILILNWNGWKYTIECLESIQRIEYSNYNVMIVDNDSQDNSIENIKLWASNKLICNQSPFVNYKDEIKTIRCFEYNRSTAEFGGDKTVETEISKLGPKESLLIVQAGLNLGFAGGNNIGLRYVLASEKYEYVWLLNNDTVIKPDALLQLVKQSRMELNCGMCGSTLLYYDEPNKVQALGGAIYNKWLGISKHIGQDLNIEHITSTYKQIKIDYVIGASMLVSSKMVKDIGLMCEDYFLYFEEIDWAKRAMGKYRLAYAKDSIVYHREGATISGKNNSNQKSYIADYYGIRNRLIFTKKYYKALTPLIYIGLILSILNRIRRRQWDRCLMIMKIMVGK